jgi:hypothetical protein
MSVKTPRDLRMQWKVLGCYIVMGHRICHAHPSIAQRMPGLCNISQRGLAVWRFHPEEEPLLEWSPDKKVEKSSLNQRSDMQMITRKRLTEFAARYPETHSALEHWY